MKRMLMLSAVAAVATCGAVMSDLPPCVVTGKITDWNRDRMQCEGANAKELRAYKGKTMIACSKLKNIDGVRANYSLSIPMTTAEGCADAAKTGETLSIVLADKNGKEIFANSNFTSVGAPGTVKVVDFLAAEDSDGNGVSDLYEQEIAWVLEDYRYAYPELGITDTVFRAEADWDGDGLNNLDEYLAGTDPFTPGDGFKILDFKPVSGRDDMFALTFRCSNRRDYKVEASTNLNEKVGIGFRHRKFFKEPGDKNGLEYITTGNETGDYETFEKTIYILKEHDKEGFFKIICD